jgi:hypothetical protein
MEAELLLWTKIAAIGQVAGAIATTAAVFVSLWIVLSERQPRVKVTAGLRLLITQGRPDLAEEVISITVLNAGLRPVSVASIGWRVGWMKRFGPEWARMGHAIQTSSGRRDSADPPYVLEPGQQKSMLIDLAPFHGDQARSKRSATTFARVLPHIGLVPANIRCAAHVVGARSRYFKVEPSLGKFLMSGEPSGGLEKLKAAKKDQASTALGGSSA